MTTTPKQALVVVVTLITVLGGVAPGLAGASVAPADAETDELGEPYRDQPADASAESIAETSAESTSTAGDADEGTSTAEVSGTLRMRMESAGENDRIPVIVVFEKRPKKQFDLQSLDTATATQKLKDLAASQQERAKSYVRKQQERNRAGPARTLWSSNAMAVTATKGTIEDLAGMPNVERIVYDRKVTRADAESGPFAEFLSEYRNDSAAPQGFEKSTSGERAWGVDYIGADAVQERGVTGQGVNVSVIDTGIDGDHPALDGAVTEWKDFTPDNDTVPTDPEGHGTHVAGTIAARPTGEYAVGVAPGANLFGAKVFAEDAEYTTRVSDIVTAMEWSANNSADVISASIGISPYVDEQGANESTGADGQLQSDVRVYANASGATSANFSTDAYKPAYVFVIVEPVAVNGSTLNESEMAAVRANTSVSLMDPSGAESLTGVNATWAFPSGEVPDQVIVKKYKPDQSRALTQAGNWTLTITSDTGKNVTYDYATAPVYPSNGSDELAESVNTIATSHDVVPVIAAGNYGTELGNRTVSSPGTASEAITVGASGYRVNDVAIFSSRGPVDYGADERPGVDVMAPGVEVLSTVPTEMYPESPYGYSSGTSMATPHVSGTLALMLAADGTQTPSELESTLKTTAQDVPVGENAAGAGVVDAYAAVNATNASALGPESSEAGRHTLYAGLGNTSDTSVYVDVQPHEDPQGDAGNAPDIWLTKKMVAQHFELTTYDDTAPNATFRMYIDIDRDDSTGDADQGGAEFMVVLNRSYDGATYSLSDETYEYNASAGSYENTYNLSAYTGDVGARYIELHGLSFDNREDTKPFDWHVTSAPEGASPGDRFPDNGQATHGVSKTINGTAVAWNASAGEPASGAPVTFKVYNDSGGIVSNRTVQADADGRASADTRVTLTDAYEDDFVLEITDTHGNEIRQYTDISDACLSCRLGDAATSGISYDFESRYYDVGRNQTVSINIPVYKRVDGNFSKYTGEASLRIGGYENYHYIDNITVDDGVVRAEIDLNQTRIDERDTFLDIHLALEGDYRNASATTDAGSMYIQSTTETSLAPLGTTVSPGESATISFQNVEYRSYSDTEPANVSTEYEVLWITDRNVASLYAELDPSLVEKIQQRKHTLGSDESVALTAEERREIRQTAKNLSEQGVHIKTTTGTAAPEKRGIGTFDVSPPEDARFGLVGARPNVSQSDYFSGSSIVLVEDRIGGYADRRTEPAEFDRYELQVDAYWDDVYDGENGTNLPEDHFNVTVRLYDWKTDSYVENADVKLYTTFGQSRTVNTGTSGEVQATFSVPDRDWLNTSYDFRDQDVLGVAVGYQTADGGPVDDQDTIYGDAYQFDTETQSGVIAQNELNYIGNGTLETTINYRNDTWDWTAGKETLVMVARENPDRDLLVDFVDPAGQTNITVNATDETLGTDERATYDSETLTADREFSYHNFEEVAGFSVTVEAPQTVTDASTSTVTITVTDRNGEPIEGAAVRWHYLLEEIDHTRSGEASLPPQVDGGTRIAVTDSNGQATVEVSPDIAEAVSSKDIYYQVGVATENQSDTEVRSGAIRVEQEQGNVTGRIVYPDGTTTKADDLVFAWGYGTSDRTDADGRFRMSIGDGTADVVFYQQHDNDSLGPLDGAPDVYAVKEVQGNASLGNVTLPEANRLNVTVVDENGDPVENAIVGVKHTRNGADGGWFSQTNAAGMFETSNRSGFEGVGNITVQVRPPENSTRFADQEVVRNVTLDQDKGITVTLADAPAVEGRVVYPDNTTQANDTVFAPGYDAFNRTDADGRFSLSAGDGSSEVEFYQTHGPNWTPGAPDDAPDLYALGEVSGDTDLGNVTLPNAHRLNVTVVDESGDPVEGADVEIFHTRNGATASGNLTTTADGLMRIEGRDAVGVEAVGNLTVLVTPPSDETYFTEQTVVREVTLTSDDAIQVTLEEKELVRGRIVYPDNTTVANDSVIAWGWNEWIRTNADGTFYVPVRNGTSDVVFYQRHDGGAPGPIDGVPDAYALGTFNNSTDLGNISLPEPHRLNVTVVTDDGTPVRNASVSATHRRNGASGGWAGGTNDQGEYTVSNRTGIELVGNVSVKVKPPRNATGFENETAYRNFTVTQDEDITVTLNTTAKTTDVELVPSEANATVGTAKTYDVVVTNASDGVGAYEANLTLANASVAEIVAVELAGNPGVSTVNVSADNSSVYFDGALADTPDSGRVVIASVTVQANEPGETGVGLQVDALGDEYGVSYNVTATRGASLNVSDIGKLRSSYAGSPTDPDNDGVYEDINGDGTFDIVDIQALYTVRDDEVVQQNAAAFNVNGDTNDAGEPVVDIVDVQALYVEQREGGDA